MIKMKGGNNSKIDQIIFFDSLHGLIEFVEVYKEKIARSVQNMLTLGHIQIALPVLTA
jgi:hypothetical protein